MIDKVGPSLSFITTFIGVEGDSKELKLPAGNIWYYGSYVFFTSVLIIW